MMTGAHTNETREAITKHAEEIAKVLLGLNTWRTKWRVEIDGCVFKIDISGYPKHGSERYKQREAYNAGLLAESDASEEYAAELRSQFPDITDAGIASFWRASLLPTD